MYTSTITTCIYTRCMYTDEEMAGKRVKSDTDGETGETKQDEDRTHMDEESGENYEELQEEDNTLCQFIYY